MGRAIQDETEEGIQLSGGMGFWVVSMLGKPEDRPWTAVSFSRKWEENDKN